jgi:hypothetical protein
MNNFKNGLLNEIKKDAKKFNNSKEGQLYKSLNNNEDLKETIFEEFDGSITYSIIKGVFYIPDLHSKHLSYKVMKHIKYEKPIIEYCFDKVKAETVLKELMQVDTPLNHFDKSVLQK